MRMKKTSEVNVQNHLPNILSLSRILLGALFFLLLRRATAVPAAVCLAIIGAGMLTDYLDGKLARRNNLVTLAGKWIDPICDFTFFFFVYLSFFKLGLMPLVLFILFLIREASMYGLIRPLYFVRKIDPAAKIPGKVKTVFQNIGSAVITFLILLERLGLFDRQLTRLISVPLLSLMVALSLLSVYWYVKPLVGSRRKPRQSRSQNAAE